MNTRRLFSMLLICASALCAFACAQDEEVGLCTYLGGCD